VVRAIAPYVLTIVLVPVLMGGLRIAPELVRGLPQLFGKRRRQGIGFIVVLFPRSLPQTLIMSALSGLGAVLLSASMFRVMGVTVQLFGLLLAGLVAIAFEILVLSRKVRFRRLTLTRIPPAESLERHNSLGTRKTEGEIWRSELLRFLGSLTGLVVGAIIGVILMK
jgi:hypothetical protein